jgi:hypothetical protein
MALNPFFLQGSITEQGLIQDLINEQLKMYGVDVYYIPRQYVNEKTIIKEVIESQFKYAYPIEAYIDTYEGYSGAGTLMSKFGIQELDDVNLIISRERYETYLKPIIENLPNIKLSSRPKEGDLIYFPLGDRLFEIKYVEHEKPFYQLKKNYVYELRCELFRYNNEIIDTEIEFIDDNIENEGYVQTLTLVGLGSLPTAYTGLINGGVRYITVTNRGKGYTSTPIVAISSSPEPNGSALGIATMINGLSDLCEPNSNLLRIQGVELKNAGYGYTVAPSVNFIGGNGKGATATSVIGNGIIGIITITSGGYGYVDPPLVTISSPGAGSTATASFIGNINSSGFVTSISIVNQNGFFDDSNILYFPPPIGVNAVVSPSIGIDGEIISMAISNPGTGYTISPLPSIRFTGGGLTTSTYKFGSSSSQLNGSTSDIILSGVGSDIFRNGRIDFWLKLGNAAQPGIIIYGKGLYGSSEWQIKLNSNLKVELSVLSDIESVEVPISINDGEWHFISLQKTQNMHMSSYTTISIDGTSAVISSVEPNLYLASEGVLIKNSVNTGAFVDSFRITEGCVNYDSSVPTTEFVSDNNTRHLCIFEHALASLSVSDGKIVGITTTYSGSGYSSIPTTFISSPSKIITAKGKTSVNNEGKITSILITNPGFGYSTSPVVSIASTSTQKQTATARANINSAGIVTSINITNSGLGYIQTPIISFTQPPVTGIGTYIFNEEVVGSVSNTKARVKSWDFSTRKIEISNITGQFLTGEYLIGQTSGSSYKINLINTDNLQDPYAQNDEIQKEANEIIDFSEKNPFGTV